MNRLNLGKSNLSVSPVFQGSDVFGSKLNKETAFSLMDHYFEKGGNVIDTGNFYASWLPGFVGGESETVVGAWLKERNRRNQTVLCTKLGFDYPSSPDGLSAKEIENECNKSLKRLQTDYLDVYYAHRDDFETTQEETMEAFHKPGEGRQGQASGGK